MRLSDFNFFRLADENIALAPPMHRDECKLMVVHKKSGTIDIFKRDSKGRPKDGSNKKKKEYLDFRNVLDYFKEGDTFVFNDTKVFPARVYANKEKTDSIIEVFVLRELSEEMHLWDALVDPARKIRIGNKLYFRDDSGLVAEVVDNTTSRGRTLRFLYDCSHEEFKQALYKAGSAPIPEYLKAKRDATPEDLEDYQCLFAKNLGAVTAPESGFHFSREMLKRMEIRDINMAYVTMHISLACYNIIDVEDLSKHKPESEQIQVTEEACDIINKAKANGKKIIAVGTNTWRTMEATVGTDGKLKPYKGWTSKFIFPPYNTSLANCMIGNFYHPLSPMLMMECAFGGYELICKAYKLALDNNFKFGCYGDAMLILND